MHIVKNAYKSARIMGCRMNKLNTVSDKTMMKIASGVVHH